MVLTSIIIGLGITHLLTGFAAAIERLAGARDHIRVSVTHACWAGFVFIWLVSFWWWQFRLLGLVSTWTIGRYLFIMAYAVVLYLLAVMLVPRDWDAVGDLDSYFLLKRGWFFSLFLIANLLDLVDSLLKGGWTYMVGTGPMAVGLLAATIPAVIIGITSTNVRVHASMAVVLFVWQIVLLFAAFPQLNLGA